MHIDVARDEDQRHGVHARKRPHVDAAVGLVPERYQVGEADRYEIDGAADNAVIELGGSTERDPIDRDVSGTQFVGVLLDQLPILHQHELHVDEPILLADVDFADFCTRARGEKRTHSQHRSEPTPHLRLPGCPLSRDCGRLSNRSIDSRDESWTVAQLGISTCIYKGLGLWRRH
jgi:hypothetical protein